MTALPTGPQRIGIDLLHEWDENPREIDPKEFQRLKKSLKTDPELLKARPLLALPDGRVFAGNMRLRALRELGWLEVDTFVMDIESRKAFEIAMRDNNNYGHWVDNELALLVDQYQSAGGDLELLGFTDDRLSELLSAPDSPPAGDAGTDPPLPEDWQLLVTCEDETAQAALIERLTEEGYEVRALIT